MDDFARAFHHADTVHITDIYAASEAPIPGVTSEVLVERLRAYGHKGARYVGSLEAGVDSVADVAKNGDAIVTLGAGSVSAYGERILQKLRSAA